MGEGKGKKEVPELVHTQLVWPTSGSWIPAIFDFPFHTFHKFLFEPSQNSEHQDSHYCQPCKPATIACSQIGSKIRPVENCMSPDIIPRSPFFPANSRSRQNGRRNFFGPARLHRDCVAKNRHRHPPGRLRPLPVRPSSGINKSHKERERERQCVRKTGEISVHTSLLHDCLRSSHPISERGTGSFFVLCGVLSLDGQE